MKVKNIIFIITIVLATIPSCVYEFDPKIDDSFINHLVVFASLTNEDEIFEVELGRTGNLENKLSVPETNAEILLLSDAGDEIELFESEPGKYKTEQTFRAIKGVKYKIRIMVRGRTKVYESEYEELPDLVDVKDVGFDFIEIPTDEPGEKVGACQFYVDVESSGAHFLRFEMGETWEIEMPYVPYRYYNGVEFVTPDLSSTCWKTNKIDEIRILNTKLLGSSSFSDFPLTQVTYETNRFRIKYCLTVKQFNMSKRVYEYWKSQEENIGTNTLYAKNPYQTLGNISNLDNPDEPVLGIFEVSSVSQNHVFVSDVPTHIASGFSECDPYYPPTESDYMNGYYLIIVDPMGGEAVVPKRCVECEKIGAESEKPDFWE